MPECTHKWQGDCTGVHCLICGKQLSRAEYAEMLRLSRHIHVAPVESEILYPFPEPMKPGSHNHSSEFDKPVEKATRKKKGGKSGE